MKVAQYHCVNNNYWNYRDQMWVRNPEDATHLDFEAVALHYPILEYPLMWREVTPQPPKLDTPHTPPL